MSSCARFFIVAVCLWPAPVLARFHHDDARMLDQDYNFNTETYNDKLSYRLPLKWRRLWNSSSSGYRVSAGSLTVSRFNYDEDLKIDPIALEAVSLAYEQSRREDYSEMQEEKALTVGIKLLPEVRLLVMGDGGVLKEYGDMGAGLRFFESKHHHTDVYGWSTDHYYNEKAHEPGANRQNMTKTFGLRSRNMNSGLPLSWQGRFEVDLPVDWLRPSEGLYQYERRMGDLRLEWCKDCAIDDTSAPATFLEVNIDHKTEGFETLDKLTHFRLKREAAIYEIGREFNISGDALSASLITINRKTTWQRSGDPAVLSSWLADRAPNHSIRREIGVFAALEKPIFERSLFVQSLTANHVNIDEAPSHWQANEIKYGTAINWQFTERAGFGLSATWDINQLTEDFPFKKQPFRPWGGGNIQAQMTF